ncbi:MAG: U32 family peptidase, partial [Clostridia bacterium]|nr:U32 family peptidase [Clostridia bacterium]
MEIFAPAGNFESLKQAVQSGADCVYLGLDSFNARMKADNFTAETLAQAVQLCHLYGTKVFLTLNILVKPNEFEKALDVASQAYMCGVDGIICADFGLCELLAKHLPGCDVVFSTQANVQNSEGCTVSKQLGINSLVLSREIDKKTVLDVRKNHPDINIEYFVQGALCVSVSGQCQMSSAVDAYSGNRGQCKQPCRQNYSCFSDGKKINEGYLLSTKDLCLADKIGELKQLGINRVKIEGRNRRKEYVGQATEVYRKAIDGKTITQNDYSNLKKMFNRGDYTKGYMYEADFGKIIYPHSQGHKGLEVGKIDVVKDKFCIASVNQKFKSEDAFKIFRNNIEVGNAVFAEDQNGKIKLSYSGKIKPGDKLNVTTQNALLEQYADLTKKIGASLQVDAKVGQPIKCSVTCKNQTFLFESDFVCEKAQNNPTSSQEIAKQMAKLGETQFTILDIVVENDDIFIPKSKINEFRRQIFEQLAQKLTCFEREKPNYNLPQIESKTHQNLVAVCISHPEQVAIVTDCDYIIVKPQEYTKAFLDKFDCKFYLDLPNFALKDDVDLLKKLVAENDNIIGISANS